MLRADILNIIFDKFVSISNILNNYKVNFFGFQTQIK